MERGLRIFNLVLAILFAAFFSWTFFARGHLESLARGFVLAKTEQYATPLVEDAEKLLQAPFVQKWLQPQWRKMVENEIADYREHPRAYLANLTREAGEIPAAERGQKLLEWKQSVRRFYEQRLAGLVRDLRIFSGTNLVAAVLAVLLSWRNREIDPPNVVPITWLLSIGILYCSWLYVDSFSFFTILFNSYLGWWYPILLAGGILLAWFDRSGSATT